MIFDGQRQNRIPGTRRMGNDEAVGEETACAKSKKDKNEKLKR
jgi:hypothetical protein